MPVPCGEYGKTETGGVRDMTRDQFLCEQMGLSQTYTPEGYDFIQVERDFGKYPADILALQQWVMDDDQHNEQLLRELKMQGEMREKETK